MLLTVVAASIAQGQRPWRDPVVADGLPNVLATLSLLDGPYTTEWLQFGDLRAPD
jgi:hypothetical protein